MEATTGRAFFAAPLPWWRGRAHHQDDMLVLDDPVAYEAAVDLDRLTADDAIADLAALGAMERDSPQAHASALQVVERHGFLRIGPQAGLQSEPYADMHREASFINRAVGLYLDLQGRAPWPDSGTLEGIAERWGALLREAYGARLDNPVREWPALAWPILTALVNSGPGARLGEGGISETRQTLRVLLSDTEKPNVGIQVTAPHLLGLVYAHLGYLIAGRVEMRRCSDPKCGRLFPRGQGRKYCSREHETRHRSRRWAAENRRQKKEANRG